MVHCVLRPADRRAGRGIAEGSGARSHRCPHLACPAHNERRGRRRCARVVRVPSTRRFKQGSMEFTGSPGSDRDTPPSRQALSRGCRRSLQRSGSIWPAPTRHGRTAVDERWSVVPAVSALAVPPERNGMTVCPLSGMPVPPAGAASCCPRTGSSKTRCRLRYVGYYTRLRLPARTVDADAGSG